MKQIKGSIFHYSTSTSKDEQKTRMNYNYITLPVLLRATFGTGKYQYFANAGPYFGHLLKQVFVTKDDGEKTTSDNTDKHHRFDVGITTGVGLMTSLSPKLSLSFEARNNLGLYNVSDTELTDGGTIKTNSTNLLFGIAYKLGKSSAETK